MRYLYFQENHLYCRLQEAGTLAKLGQVADLRCETLKTVIVMHGVSVEVDRDVAGV